MSIFGLKANSSLNDIMNQVMPFVYNSANGLRIWRSEIAKLKSGATNLINLNILGTSITEGVGTSDYPNGLTKGYAHKLRTALALKFGDVGFGLIPNYFPTNSPKLTFSAHWTTNNLFGIHGTCKQTTDSSATITFSFSGTGLSILCDSAVATGKLNVSIDGGANIEVNTAGFTYGHIFDVVSGLADGNHNVVISKYADNKPVWFDGIIVNKGIVGVRVNNMGQNGSTISSCYSTGKYWLDAEINGFSPKLTIIEHLINDQFGQTPLDTYKSTMQTVITCAKQYGDVLILTAGVKSPAGSPITQQQYVDVLYQLTKDNNCVLVDIFNRWGASGLYAQNTLGLQTDGTHPNDYGATDISTALLNVLLEDR